MDSVPAAIEQHCEELRSCLQRTSDLLISGSDNYGALWEQCGAAYSALSEFTNLPWESMNPDDAEPAMTDHGKAISPKEAARCILELARTAAFVRGVHAALTEALLRFPSGTVEVLYAGCGPLAPLFIFPMMRLAGERIRFTLLDLHRRSLDAARQVCRTLGLDRHVREYVVGDAVEYRHPVGRQLHVVVTETMQRALTKEPQVAITGNLGPQLCDGAILIPEKISIEAALVDFRKEFTFLSADSPDAPFPECVRDRIGLGEILEVSAGTAHRLHPFQLGPAKVSVPELPGDNYALALLTSVTVFGPHAIRDYDSSITLPVRLRDIRRAETPAEVEFTYKPGKCPGFHYTIG